MDYKSAGVDIEAGYKSVELMKEHVRKTMRPEVLTNLGGFSGAFSMEKFKDMEKPSWMIYLPAGLGFLQFIICMMLALRIEQVAGYYECRKCGHRYVPTYKAVNLAMHMGRTRSMKCPKCGKMSWQRKVISDGEQEK